MSGSSITTFFCGIIRSLILMFFVMGHCNITQDRIIQISDRTGAQLLKTFGSVRETFFTGLSALVVEDEERQVFLNTYLGGPALAAYERGEHQAGKELLCHASKRGDRPVCKKLK